MTCRSVLILVATVCCAAPAAGQTPLSLDDARRRAVAESLQVADARTRELAAAAAVRSRQSLSKPTITASSGVVRTNRVDPFGLPRADGSLQILYPDIPMNYRVRAEAGIPLYTAGRVAAQVAAAESELRAAETDRRTLERDVQLDATRAYLTLATANETVRVLEQAVSRAEAVERDVAARVDAGVLPPNEVANARAQRARQQIRLIHARQEVVVAETDLSRVIGGSVRDRYQLTTPLDEPLPDTPFGDLHAEPLIAQALSGRLERDSLEHRHTALRANVDAARAAARPQLNALAAVEPARPNPRYFPRMDVWHTSWDLAVQVTWTLWDGGRARAEQAVADANVQSLVLRLEQFDDALAIDVVQRTSELAANRAARAAVEEVVAAAVEALRVVQERFDAGVATPTEILDAQVSRLEAELERTQLAARLRLSEARLLRTLGVR